MIIAMCIVCMVMCVLVLFKTREQNREIDEVWMRLSLLDEKYKAAEGLIADMSEAAQEAAKSERMFQDGLMSIINYDAQAQQKGGGDK